MRTLSAVGRPADALAHYGQLRQQRALALAAQSGDVTDQALGHHHLARAWESLGDERRALIHAEHALRLIRTVDNPVLATSPITQTITIRPSGTTARPSRSCANAATRSNEADILDNIAKAQLALRQFDRARVTWEQALALYKRQQRLADAQNVMRHLASAGVAGGSSTVDVFL